MSSGERWRLLLGSYAAKKLPPLDGDAARLDAALDFLYGREYEGRGQRPAGDDTDKSPGSLDPSSPMLVDWLTEVRDLFPNDAVEVIERHALERYELTGLVNDPQVLARLEPNETLLKLLLGLRRQLNTAVLGELRRIIRVVVEELRRRLESEIRQSLSGRLSQHRHSPLPVAANFDPRGTIRANLKNWDKDRRQLILQELRFFERNTRRLPWEVVLVVDQSGSMVGSVIHSAVMAGILAGLPAYQLKLVLFDTSIVDLSDRADDPVEVLMSVQLGGGTDIAQAVQYAGQIIDNPHRAVVVLITDFAEGGPPSALIAAVRTLAEARVRMIGLASLDGDAHPAYDRAMAERLADEGMHIAALTPARLAEWLAEVTAR